MTKLLTHFHRIFGTLLSLIFLVWFLSGFVMMYHHFPNIGSKEYRHLRSLPDSLPNISVIKHSIPLEENIKSLSVMTFRQEPVFRVETKDTMYLLSVDTLPKHIELGVPFDEIISTAKDWSNADIISVDTMRSLDQWIPYSDIKNDFPIYKFSFADKDKTYLYISSLTGKVLQCVTKEQRFWAWVGPIPHLLYFHQLRQNRDRWSSVISWLAGAGSLVCLAGIILGIRGYIINYRKKRRFATPYKKFYFKWHHILGFFFGFFTFMFVLSGLMSLNDLPQWIVKTHDKSIQEELRKRSNINIDAFQADYRTILKQYPNEVKEITFEQFGNKPYFSAVINEKKQNFDASQPYIKSLYLSQKDILDRLSFVGDKKKNISLMTSFDNYYVGFTKRMELPVYKVVVTDKDNSLFYVNPKTGTIRYFNNNQRAGKWIYPAFHSLRFKFFSEHRLMRDVIMWILLIGGTLLSFTGVVLGIRYVIRIVKSNKL